MKTTLETSAEIQQMVKSFYTEIQKDKTLGPIFDGIIQDRWEEHLAKMYRFWESLLLGEDSYQGTPFTPHVSMDIDASHFEKWIYIFKQNIDNQFESEKANEAKTRAESIARVFSHKIESLRMN